MGIVFWTVREKVGKRRVFDFREEGVLVLCCRVEMGIERRCIMFVRHVAP